MPKIRMLLAYDGTSFRGWATQRGPSLRTVQGELTAHLSRVLLEPVKLAVAGRTDAGVHALGQVMSFSTASSVTPGQLQRALNSVMSPEVVVHRASYAPETFDARFSATAREYRYVIRTAQVADVFSGRFEWHRPKALAIGPMRRAAQSLLGEHDFATFCRHPGTGKSTVRDLQRLTIARHGEVVVLKFKANAFLHQMVRALVGTLVMVGEGKFQPEDVGRMLAARSRIGTPNVAPARGLTLVRVEYPAGPSFDARSAQPVP